MTRAKNGPFDDTAGAPREVIRLMTLSGELVRERRCRRSVRHQRNVFRDARFHGQLRLEERPKMTPMFLFFENG